MEIGGSKIQSTGTNGTSVRFYGISDSFRKEALCACERGSVRLSISWSRWCSPFLILCFLPPPSRKWTNPKMETGCVGPSPNDLPTIVNRRFATPGSYRPLILPQYDKRQIWPFKINSDIYTFILQIFSSVRTSRINLIRCNVEHFYYQLKLSKWNWWRNCI